MNIQTLQRQSGFSLVELMIALVLGLFLIAGMISLFVNSKGSYLLNENMGRLQENARFAVAAISRDMRMADYHACVIDPMRNDAITGQNNVGLNASDAVSVLWLTNSCGTASSTEIRSYSVQTGLTGGPALFRSIDGVNQELVEGIESLQIWYGEDTDRDFIPNFYVDAATITDMAQVVSVRFTVIARTLETGLVGRGDRITRAFSTTVTLRNRVP